MKARLSVYFDYIEAQLVPVWLIIKFKPGGIDWTQECLYIPVHLPFHRYMAEDFDDQIISLSIAQTELVVSPERPSHFGIHLPTVKQRINKLRGEKCAPRFLMDDIQQLVIQICDIEEVLQMNVMSVFAWK
ncbi:hypothetical protein KP806_07445 [Paenibacillus sp. N4]|uniref:hypothetical protein n=1 Tax=Paenibacillus vietnamensis TaxID=2590547 RepID=UPI001CD0F703|nr:hypothetical protein [Paenibacillus vietnamensis]MCA0754880.1 hypothetical protein [Paenibacillus vietnamensis]